MSNDARNMAIYLARRLSGKTQAAIGDAFVKHCSSLSGVVSKTAKTVVHVDASMPPNRLISRTLSTVRI